MTPLAGPAARLLGVRLRRRSRRGRKQKEKQRESALRELADQERFQDDRMRRCRDQVNDAWQDCFFLGTTRHRAQQRRGPATW